MALSKTQKIGLIIVIVTGLGIGAWFLYDKVLKPKDDKKKDGDKKPDGSKTDNTKPADTLHITSPSIKTNSTPVTPAKNFISYGDKNANVAVVQNYLKKRYNADLGSTVNHPDGIDYDFGDKTLAALQKYEGVDSVSKDLFLKMSNYLRTAGSIVGANSVLQPQGVGVLDPNYANVSTPNYLNANYFKSLYNNGR